MQWDGMACQDLVSSSDRSHYLGHFLPLDLITPTEVASGLEQECFRIRCYAHLSSFFFFLKAFLHVLLDVTFRTHQKWSLKLSGTTGWVKVPIQMEIKCSVDCPNCQHTYTYTPHLHIHTLTPHLTFPYHLSITVRACLIDTFLIRKTGAAYWNTYY